MALLISGIRLPLGYQEEDLVRAAAKQISIDAKEIHSSRLLRRSLDARKKQDIHYLASAAVELSGEAERRILRKNPSVSRYLPPEAPRPSHGTAAMRGRVVVAGFGPAGMFAGWLLSREGYAPLILERGGPIAERSAAVEKFWAERALDPETNVMFGEGGAGTFSDGKLTSRSKDGRGELVLRVLHRYGAPEEILYDGKPHIGTDRLRSTVSELRRDLERMGAEIRFHARLEDIRTEDGRIRSVSWHDGESLHTTECSALILAIGQGARDTVRMLMGRGLFMEKKPFAVGIRVEHPQEMINRSQYGAMAGKLGLGAADYRLTARSGDRGVYTFCMCPGGQVIASSSSEGQVVVNGMSNYARDGANSNSAVVVQIFNSDTPEHPLGGMAFQEKLEQDAFRLGGTDYSAPASRVEDFLRGRASSGFGAVRPTYRPGVRAVRLADCLPDPVAAALRDGISAFARQLPGYDLADAVMTGTETRTSSPVRMTRDGGLESVSVRDVYPVGEGAGYAGGIVSAAIDGLRAAEQVIGRFAPEMETQE